MLADLDRSGLTEEDAGLMRLRTCREGELPEIQPPGDGYVIPYFTVDGRVNPALYRYRYLGDPRKGFARLANGKVRRYTQPAGTPPGVYWPPGQNWQQLIAEVGIPLIITEGEKKAAIATKLGLPCIGLGGVWSFRSKARGVHLLPELAAVEWKNRIVCIAYDSDAALNADVCRAEIALCDTLVQLGAQVKVARLPELVEGQKCALDDYLVNEGAERFAKLVEETEPYAQGRELHRLNAEVVYVQDPGVVYVRDTGQVVRASDFTSHRYADRKYTKPVVDTKGMPRLEVRRTAPDWLQWEHRSVARRFVFEPGDDDFTEAGELNLWRGWPYEPQRGDVTPWTELLNFLFRQEPEARRYFEQWVAYPVQHPGTKLRNAVALWGVRKGTGKSLVGYTIGDLYGDAFYEISDQQLDGTSPFNEWARHRHFIMGDEITGNDSRRIANRIKHMVTREKVEINSKNTPQYSIRDCINYYFTAQHPDCFYLEEDDRRIFVHEVRGAALSNEFYTNYNLWRSSAAGRRALMWHLMHVDTSDFNPMARPPETLAKIEMITNSRTELESWLSVARDHPDLFCSRVGNSDLVTINELIVMHEGEGHRRASPNLIARKLKELGLDPLYPADSPTTAQIFAGGKLIRLYALRNAAKWKKCTIAQLREEYERSRGLAAKKMSKKF